MAKNLFQEKFAKAREKHRHQPPAERLVAKRRARELVGPLEKLVKRAYPEAVKKALRKAIRS